MMVPPKGDVTMLPVNACRSYGAPTFTEPNGDSWLVIDTIVTDRTYLTQPYVNSVSFKKQRDAAGWDPTPCRADQPR